MNLYKLHKNPKSLDHYDAAKKQVPRLAWELHLQDWEKRSAMSDLFAKDPHTAVMYALDFLDGERFGGAEAVIATSAEYSYEYATYVLGGRFEKGEAAISKSGKYSYLYAYHALEDRFPLGEKAIMASIYKQPYQKFLESIR